MIIQKEKIAILANRSAKNLTNFVTKRFTSLLPKENIFQSTKESEVENLLNEILKKNYDLLISAGGDGTFFNMATNLWKIKNKAPDLKLPLISIFRLGTGNAVGSVFKIPKYYDVINKVVAGEYKIKKCSFIEFDGRLATFGDTGWGASVLNDYGKIKPFSKYFFHNDLLSYLIAAFGITAPVQLSSPKATVSVTSTEEVFRYNPREKTFEQINLKENQNFFTGKYNFCGVATTEEYGFEIVVYPYAQKKEGFFNFRLSNATVGEFVSNIHSIWRGEYISERVTDYFAKSLTFEFDKKVELEIGGDACGYHNRFDCKLSDFKLDLLDFS